MAKINEHIRATRLRKRNNSLVIKHSFMHGQMLDFNIIILLLCEMYLCRKINNDAVESKAFLIRTTETVIFEKQFNFVYFNFLTLTQLFL